MFPKIVGFPPKSSILIGISIFNHPYWGFSHHFRTHPDQVLEQLQASRTATITIARKTVTLTFARPWVVMSYKVGPRVITPLIGVVTPDTHLKFTRSFLRVVVGAHLAWILNIVMFFTTPRKPCKLFEAKSIFKW